MFWKKLILLWKLCCFLDFVFCSPLFWLPVFLIGLLPGYPLFQSGCRKVPLNRKRLRYKAWEKSHFLPDYTPQFQAGSFLICSFLLFLIISFAVFTLSINAAMKMQKRIRHPGTGRPGVFYFMFSPLLCPGTIYRILFYIFFSHLIPPHNLYVLSQHPFLFGAKIFSPPMQRTRSLYIKKTN